MTISLELVVAYSNLTSFQQAQQVLGLYSTSAFGPDLPSIAFTNDRFLTNSH
jgi:hypothetical protein